jgi:GNAT superfamily N-acetyltransferase
MDKVVSYEQVQGFIGEIRDLRQGFVTNFFWNDQKHPYWVSNGSLFFEKAANSYILLHHDEGFDSLFYIAANMKAVADAISTMPLGRDSIIDLVCKDGGEQEKDTLTSIGFEPYKRLYRMSHLGVLAEAAGWEISPDVSLGHEDDAPLVHAALREGFDPLCEQLPTLQEVNDFARREQLLVVKEAGRLCGFLISETAGKTSWYLRYWYTSLDDRDKGVGGKLLKTALTKAKETRRQQLWVISDNENAIRRYEHYGFKREPISDFVMIKRI